MDGLWVGLAAVDAPVNLNTASIPALAEVVGLPRAYDLFLWRPFRTWDDVMAVPGITDDEACSLRRAGAHIGLPDQPPSQRDALDARLGSIDRGLRRESSAQI